MLICCGLESPLQAQEKMREHTVLFYPLYSNRPIGDYGIFDIEKLIPANNNAFRRRPINPSFGIGYNYRFYKDWAWEAKFFVQQEAKRTSSTAGTGIEKHLKLGLKYYMINRKVQLSLGSYYYLSGRKIIQRIFSRNGSSRDILFKEKEVGLEIGLDLAYRITKEAKVVLGSAFRFSSITKKRGLVSSPIMDRLFLPFESLGFAYTF